MPHFQLAFSDPLLTVRELATKLRVSRATVWRMVAAGRLPDPVYPSWRTPRWVESACDAALACTTLPPREAKALRRKATRPRIADRQKLSKDEEAARPDVEGGCVRLSAEPTPTDKLKPFDGLTAQTNRALD